MRVRYLSNEIGTGIARNRHVKQYDRHSIGKDTHKVCAISVNRTGRRRQLILLATIRISISMLCAIGDSWRALGSLLSSHARSEVSVEVKQESR
jgi:hypothetical protein